jgi:RimJ/RimL family protein N-acetyltransferase
MRHVGRPPLPDAEAYRLRIRAQFLPQYERPGGFGAFAAVERASGEFVGGCGLKPAESAAHAAAMGFVPGEVEVGLALRRHFWGRGYAAELFRALACLAFDRCGAARVVAAVSSANPDSARALEKAGLRRAEGEHFPPGFTGPCWKYALGRDRRG